MSWTPFAAVAPWRARLVRVLDRLAAARHWSWCVAGWGLVLGVLLAAVIPTDLRERVPSPQWRYIVEHSQGSLFDPDIGSTSREANLTFRVTPRLLGKVLQFDAAWQFYALQLVAGLLLLVLLARLLDEALGDRRLAVVATLGTVGLWAVACAWTETRGNFDGIAITLILGAMLTRRAPVALVVALAATFTDERIVFVLPIAAMWHLLRADEGTVRPSRSWAEHARTTRWVPVVAVLAAGPAHVAIRLALQARYGLSEGSNRSPGEPVAQLNNYPNGIWGALEGYWLFAVAGLAGLVHTRRSLCVAICSAATAVILLVGVSVFDISRSTMYVFPLVVVGAVGLRAVEPTWRRRLVVTSAIVTLVWPVLYAADTATVNWAYPLPLVIVDRLIG